MGTIMSHSPLKNREQAKFIRGVLDRDERMFSGDTRHSHTCGDPEKLLPLKRSRLNGDPLTNLEQRSSHGRLCHPGKAKWSHSDSPLYQSWMDGPFCL
ncbi:hypothetical protein AVEN_30823-1 [Araneus ventricosus]|uniref:Uncharacterized protein n=1 Tax=Araneus ventricosus TaxID=182803 RepID=A0A4Y2KN48_ARAVE|nr:hypothetical protein AVEN_30823-1 [Araneus ventricosus]